jgi:predicted dinucleotide-binding enzyme
VAPINQAVAAADVVFLATPFQANEAVLKAVGDALNRCISST